MNSKAFTPEEVEKGLFNDLINYLNDFNKKSEEAYYDIHICSDGCCMIVEWVEVSYNNPMLNIGKFMYIDSEFEEGVLNLIT